MVCIARETIPECEYFHCLGKWQMPLELACMKGACIAEPSPGMVQVVMVPSLSHPSVMCGIKYCGCPLTGVGMDPGILLV